MLLEKQDGTRTRLWVAEVRGSSVWVRSGRSGTNGRTAMLDSPSSGDARELLEREATARLAEGFVMTSETHGVSDPFVARAKPDAPTPAPSVAGIPSYLVDCLRADVMGGFTDEDDIDEVIEDLVDVNGETDQGLPAKLARLAVELFEAQRAAERTWTTPTINDAIDAAFDELTAAGIVAMQNAGGTSQMGWSVVNARGNELLRAGQRPRGATFYHAQDLESGVNGEGLWLVFGAYERDPAKHEAASIAVGHEVIAMLQRHGVATAWDGGVQQRILIPPFEWKRRHSG